MNLAAVAEIARAVLYEGYILYPYRPSSIKNRQRWTFGGVFPRDYGALDPSEPRHMQTECLLRGGPQALVDIRVRFLHIVAREIGRLLRPATALPADRDPEFTKVASLSVDGAQFVEWEEATEREVAAPALAVGRLSAAPVRIPFEFPGTREVEPIAAADGLIPGVMIRTAVTLHGELAIAAERVADDVFRLTVRIENSTPLGLTPLAPPQGGEDGPRRDVSRDRVFRTEAQRRAFVSTHTILGVRSGAFISLLDPPHELREAAARCDNQGTWPVLAGEDGRADTMLSSPIILYDHPQIARESPGDLFDGTEIDEILTLRILAMTDAEKREMAAVEPRARALLERTEALTPTQLAGLHGALRRLPARGDVADKQPCAESSTLDVSSSAAFCPSPPACGGGVAPVYPSPPACGGRGQGEGGADRGLHRRPPHPPTPAAWAPPSPPGGRRGTEDEPPSAALRVGDHVRLHPKPGADIMDLVLKDEVAAVEAIERDFEGRVHVAVTILADPGRDLGIDRMPGHRFFFALDEVEIVEPGAAR